MAAALDRLLANPSERARLGRQGRALALSKFSPDAVAARYASIYADALQHRAGLDARTIQKRLGHSDLSTTLAYLEGEEPRSERSRQQVNETFAVLAKRDEQTVVQ